MFVQEQNAQTKERLGVEDLIRMLPNLMTYRGWAKKWSRRCLIHNLCQVCVDLFLCFFSRLSCFGASQTLHEAAAPNTVPATVQLGNGAPVSIWVSLPLTLSFAASTKLNVFCCWFSLRFHQTHEVSMLFMFFNIVFNFGQPCQGCFLERRRWRPSCRTSSSTWTLGSLGLTLPVRPCFNFRLLFAAGCYPDDVAFFEHVCWFLYGPFLKW